MTTEEAVGVNGVSLFTRTIGSGPQTIILHGGPGAYHDYLLPQFDLLARGRRLRYYDQRGGGRSPVDRDVPVGWREQVADLDALITHWEAAPATLLGYSWGGLLAMLYAVQHPGRVGRLALLSPAAANSAGRAEFERQFAERANDPRIAEARRRLAASGLRQSVATLTDTQASLPGPIVGKTMPEGVGVSEPVKGGPVSIGVGVARTEGDGEQVLEARGVAVDVGETVDSSPPEQATPASIASIAVMIVTRWAVRNMGHHIYRRTASRAAARGERP